MTNTDCWIVMGVTACGKSSLAQSLAAATGGAAIEGDDYHSPANRDKMARGQALCDADRLPWLDALIAAGRAQGLRPVFIACSALAQRYRQRLRAGLDCGFIYLRISQQLAAERAARRSDHFVDPSLVASQFQCLEEPTDALVLPAELSLSELTERCLLGLQGA